MMFADKNALGIEISNDSINAVVVKAAGDRLVLVKEVSTSVPAGVMENGSIKNPAKLSSLLKDLKKRYKIKSANTAVSIPSASTLTQLMYMPKPVPANIREHFEDEVKQYAVLSAGRITLDFCGISKPQTKDKRLLVAAADYQFVADIFKVCVGAGFEVSVVEPSSVATVKAFYEKKIKAVYGRNVLIAMLENDILTSFVFKDENLDFLSTKHINMKTLNPGELCKWVADQINSFIHFYEVEAAGRSEEWQLVVFSSNLEKLSKNAESILRTETRSENLQLKNRRDAFVDTEFAEDNNSEHFSPVAAGLASGLLKKDESKLKINLLPDEVAEINNVKRDFLITAGIASVIFLVMVLTVGGLVLTASSFNRNFIGEGKSQLPSQTRILLKKQKLINMQIKALSERYDGIKNVFEAHNNVNWGYVLNDIKNSTPINVCITRLSSEDGLTISLQGLAVSYDAVKVFVDMLNKSDDINSASLEETKKDNDRNGLVRYAVNCILEREG